jgi:hypothetical protein
VAVLGGYLGRGRVIEATRALLASVRALRDTGPQPEALARAKARLKAELQANTSTNALLAASFDITGNEVQPVDPCRAAALIDAVAPDDIRTAMHAYFAEKRLGAVVIAREDQLDAWPDDLGMRTAQRRDQFGQDLR